MSLKYSKVFYSYKVVHSSIRCCNLMDYCRKPASTWSCSSGNARIFCEKRQHNTAQIQGKPSSSSFCSSFLDEKNPNEMLSSDANMHQCPGMTTTKTAYFGSGFSSLPGIFFCSTPQLRDSFFNLKSSSVHSCGTHFDRRCSQHY